MSKASKDNLMSASVQETLALVRPGNVGEIPFLRTYPRTRSQTKSREQLGCKRIVDQSDEGPFKVGPLRQIGHRVFGVHPTDKF
jgi:hypothetical protein